VPQRLGIGLPSAVSELLIDQGACRGFVKIDLGRRFLATLDELKAFRFGCLFGSSLEGGKPRSNLRRLAFAFRREPLPDRPLLGLPR
jgi:hypothetical protein